jgi:ABC-type branched-subunit amino acid transport system substrate-binding protein
MNRRRFIRTAGLTTLAVAGGARAALARGSVDLRIGVALDADDTALRGVRLGAAEAAHAARLFGSVFELHEARPGAADALRLVTETGVSALIGGSTPADADALLALAASANVLFMNVGTPMDALRRRCNARTFHVLPSDGMRTAALAAAAGPANARAAAWHPDLERFGAGQVNDRYRAMFDDGMDERAWAGWMAVKVVFDAAQRAAAADASVLAEFLTSPRAVYDGHKGVQLSFTTDTRQLRQPLYVLHDDRVVAEVPTARELGDRTHAELLDTLIAGGVTCAP